MGIQKTYFYTPICITIKLNFITEFISPSFENTISNHTFSLFFKRLKDLNHIIIHKTKVNIKPHETQLGTYLFVVYSSCLI